MKKFNWLMMLLAIFSLSFAACEPKPEPVPDPDVPTPNEELKFSNDYFDLEITELNHSSFSFVVEPTDLEGDYLCMLYDAETVEEFTKDIFIVETLYQELTAEARTKGMTFEEYMPTIVDRGVLESKYTGLLPDCEYYVILFMVDPTNEYAPTSDLLKAKIKTEEAPMIDVSFTIDTTVNGNDATYAITPSDDEVIWYFYTVPAQAYQAYTDPAGQYQMDDSRFILYCLQMQLQQLQGEGYSAQQIINLLFHKGALTLEAKGLNANMEYTNLIAAFDITAEGEITLISEVTTTNYTTGSANSQELSFEVSVTDVTTNRAAIKIVPSDQEKTYCWMVGAWDGVSTAEDVMNSIVAMYGGWMNNGAMLYTGTQDYTGGPGSAYKYKLDAPDTDYYVIAFGYAGGVTTEPVMKTFHTLPAPPAEETVFTMSATDITPYGFKLGVSASEPTTFYYMMLCPPSEYDSMKDTLVSEVDTMIEQMYEQQKVNNPDITYAQLFSLYFYDGNMNVSIGGIQPETTIMGVICALDHNTGKAVKVHEFNPLATTAALGSVHPKVEVMGQFSGDEENGSVFGNAAATAGKAITVVKYSEFDGARTLFSMLAGGDVSNVNAEGCSDPEVWDLTLDQWQTVKKSSPYSFYVASWDEPMTALTYATDSTGMPGAIGRCYSMATAENKGTLDELKQLVALADGKSESAMVLSESLVISDKPVGMMTFEIEEEESFVAPVVEAKRAATTTVVMLPSMNIDYIRPFYLHK